MNTPESFVFMKVGSHATENLDFIINRKREEIAKTGMCFWGYGGNCHPTKQVQPFVQEALERGIREVKLMMTVIKSKANQTPPPANYFSANGKDWEKIPKGILVTGSKYALVLKEIKEGELQFDPAYYNIGAGPKTGQPALGYLRGHVDKACFNKAQKPQTLIQKPEKYQIHFTGALAKPYAVFVRP